MDLWVFVLYIVPDYVTLCHDPFLWSVDIYNFPKSTRGGAGLKCEEEW